jgi:DNA-binding transcriptional MerR regulator
VDLMSIGEFAERSRLSPKALRLYGERGLLPPVRVDEDSGYRYYAPSQLDDARLIATLRQLQIPLAEIRSILELEPDAAARRIAAHWDTLESAHASRRDLARYLIGRMQGERQAMYQVKTRELPLRSILTLKRSVDGTAGAWSFGKEFLAILRERDLPRVGGLEGAVYAIYWGEVSDDSDGPIEWCRPVPAERAQELAALAPELTLRAEPAHREAFVELGPGLQVEPAHWQLVSESMHGWVGEHTAQPSELGARIVYLADAGTPKDQGPDCDFALPLA